jgi:hypothetical protein
MDSVREIVVEFDQVDPATANELADELRSYLRDAVPEVKADQRRADPLAQDFGATLVLILGSAAAKAIAKGISTWLAQRNDVHLSVSRTDAAGVTSTLKVDGRPGKEHQALLEKYLDAGN